MADFPPRVSVRSPRPFDIVRDTFVLSRPRTGQ